MPALPPISALTTPYASTPPPLNMLMLRHALPTCLPCRPHTGLIFNVLTILKLLQHPQDGIKMLLTILTLLQRPQDMPPTLPSTPLTPPPTHIILSATYHAYAHVLDS
ncbi:hypothetical protein O181_006786 [Austropuccinia psidii MF-1]|uniref:Uncharacterized protein n=1 Tax=Austropuccinia psidii MF-1 TaxID=1389203 RepID=A0A9Q3BJP7_9BASI|nr:hypothetical protein [Austropuccinia psidii MF-1]